MTKPIKSYIFSKLDIHSHTGIDMGEYVVVVWKGAAYYIMNPHSLWDFLDNHKSFN